VPDSGGGTHSGAIIEGPLAESVVAVKSGVPESFIGAGVVKSEDANAMFHSGRIVIDGREAPIRENGFTIVVPATVPARRLPVQSAGAIIALVKAMGMRGPHRETNDRRAISEPRALRTNVVPM
jgi:hypothetical protein